MEAGSPRRASVLVERCRKRMLRGENEGMGVPHKDPRTEATHGSCEMVGGGTT